MVKKAAALAKPCEFSRPEVLLTRKGKVGRCRIASAVWHWEITGCTVAVAEDESSLPPQGTLYWCGVHVWEDVTYDIVVPAVRDAIGGGNDFESAIADAREKLAVRVQDSVKEGYPVQVLNKKATELRLTDDMNVVMQRCKVLGIEGAVLKLTTLYQIDLDYDLVCK